MKALNCIIIGQTSLAQLCGEIITSSGHHLCGIISSNQSIQYWAKQLDITVWPSIDTWAQLNQPVDYIFSIVNDAILSDVHFGLAHQGVINYHDSLLPRYAGVHATSWAIMHGETQHGITWHLVDSGIDTGSILLQKSVSIESDETALSLNLKCHQAAVESFQVLINALTTGQCVVKPQDMRQRSYYPRHKKVNAGGLIDWKQSAGDIDRLFRALNFGQEPNPLGTLKLFTSKQCYQISDLACADSAGQALPGQIVILNETHLRVATNAGDILINELRTLDGEPVTFKQFAHQTELHTGDRFNQIDKKAQDRLQQICETLSSFESYWVNKIAHSQPTPLPYLDQTHGQKLNIYQNTFTLPALKSLPDGCSSEVYFMALWSIYLYRLNNYQPGTIGFPYQGLTPELASFAEFLAQNVPLNLTFEPELTFRQAYQLTEETIADVKKHKTYLRDIFSRYPDLKERTDIKSLPCQLMIGGLGENIDMDTPCAICFDPENAQYRLHLRYAPHEQDHIQEIAHQIHDHLTTILQSSLEEPTSSLVELKLLTEQEKQQLLAQASTYEADEPYLHKSIPELFAEQVMRNPDRKAVCFEKESITYQELDQRSNQLAYFLRRQGIKPNESVAVYMHRCADAIVAMLGILKIGGVYVPIDPDYPIIRFRYIIDDAAIRLVLTNKSNIKQANHYSKEIKDIEVFELAHCLSDKQKQWDIDLSQLSATDPAYIMYTSGTTGNPKGIIIPHQGVTRLVKASNLLTFKPEHIVLQIINLVFDISYLEIWGALLNGALLKILSKETVLNANQFSTFLDDSKVIVMITHALFQQIIAENARAFDKVDTIVFVGEALMEKTLQPLYQRKQAGLFQGRLINGYGPTENSIISTYYVAETIEKNTISIPIGQAVAHTQTYVLDKYLNLLPVGVTGELYLGGLGLAHGYLNKPQRTKQQFIIHSIVSDKKERLYNTNDLVRWLPDGNLDYLCRTDSQVKMRGIRIELGEIEANLLDYPSIKQAVVLLKSSQGQPQRLNAYIVICTRVSFEINELQSYLKRRLPEYMIPLDYYILDKLPTTTNGKIDKKQLEQQYIQLSPYHPPQGLIEEQLAAIWCQCFGCEKISRDDNYFSLGGDSITAMQITALAKQIGLYLKVSDLFIYSTIAELAQTVKAAPQRQSGKEFSYSSSYPFTIKEYDRLVQQFPNTECILPLLSIQQGILFHSISNQTSDTYLVQVKWIDYSGLKPELFIQAWNILIKRHSVLRARFVWDCVSQPVQLIEQAVTLPSRLSDWREFSTEKQKQKIKDWLKLDRGNTFDLGQAPLMRIHIFHLEHHQYMIVWTYHHILLGGWSLNIILKELYLVYKQLSDSKPHHLMSPPSYSDYIKWHMERDTQSTKIFWQSHLANQASTSLLPENTIEHYHLQTGTHYGVEQISTGIVLHQKLKSDAKKMHMPLSVFIITTWLGILSRYTQCHDTITGMTLAVRNDDFEGLNYLVAPVINTVPFRYHFKIDETVCQCLHHIQRLLSQVIDHGFTSLVDIRSWTLKNQKLRLFETLLVIENHPVEIDRHYIQELNIDDRTHYPITLVVFVNDELTLKIYYDESLFDVQYIRQLLKHFTILLEQIHLQPQAMMTQLPIISEQEYQRNLSQLPQQINLVNTNLVEHFIHITKLFSSRIAVSKDNVQLTYLELDQRSNQLAHYLVELGVKPGMFVALCLQRDIDVVVSILAVLKTGAAYIPIDPDYPIYRICYITQDSQASIVISETSILTKISDGFSRFNHKIDLEKQWPKISKQSTQGFNLQISENDLAYIIYTSGSTGTPKGVPITHKNVLRLFLSTQDFFHFNHEDVWTLFHSYAFDFSVWEMWGALFYGGQLVIVPYDDCRDPQVFYDLLLKRQITILNQTPSAFKMMLKRDQNDTYSLPSSLRWVIFGGEKLDSALLKPFAQEQMQDLPCFANMYGITEITVHATFHQIDLKRLSTTHSIIGKPLLDMQIYLLDKQLRPVPQGVVGEIWITGDGLSQGYWNKPELCAKRFITHPIYNQKICFKTGDLARYLNNGDLEYIGRADSQVKIRGYRIELSEITAHINQFPGVVENVVHHIEAGDQEKFLSCYLQVQDKASFDVHELKQFLNQRLPNYMIPNRYMLLDEMPHTVNGKIDHTDLSQIKGSVWLTLHTQDHQQARTPEQKILVDMWEQLLNVPAIGITDDFFELGGNSILVLELISRINTFFAIKLNLSVILAFPTIKRLADQIIALKKYKTESVPKIPSPIVPLQRTGNKTPIFLVHPVGGTIFWYKSLVRYLSKERPVYGIQDPGLESGHIFFTSFEEMAHFYMKEIRKVQKEGPYIIGGASLGANVAVEIGRQLEDSRQKVNCVLSLDGWARSPQAFNTRDFMQIHLWKQYKGFKEKLKEINADITKPKVDLHWQRSELLFKHQLTAFEFDFILFKPEKTLDILLPVEAPYNHWDKYAKNLRLIRVPGDHASMFYHPHVQTLANQLNQVLTSLETKYHDVCQFMPINVE